MKTILIAHNYTESSFAFMSYSLARHLAGQGNKVVFISHKPFFSEPFKETIEKGELSVYSWPTENRPVKFKDALWFAGLYLRYRPTVVISHFVNVNITTIVSKVLSFGKVKTFPYYHTLSNQIQQDVSSSALKRNFKKYRKKLLYKWFADHVICPSDLAKEDLERYFDCSKGIKVVNPMKDRFEIKSALNSAAIVVSYLGRLEPSKGVIDLINAFLQYKNKFQASKIILNIAGSGSQNDQIEELIGTNPNINFVGALSYDKIDAYLNQSHYTVIPSKFDNLPTVGLESMMNQTPLLISTATGLSTELQDGLDCFQFTPTIAEMVLLFERVENSFENQYEMGINARKTFTEKFGIDSYRAKMKKIIGSN
ncbi:glycosyltransferase [Flavobacterium circumlabens]|uniref:Glycosyltransferase n=1 Tax=Flavobacterium circumlabens TaxID=2133765 RepID=A0A4Y7UCC6_9FLAO|nr:glycosyltransferase [Flavobacterium circumlabens]TCN56408.1 glycosyltransferase involved in cell wall biosynthesis [Flavobacterium circumlabens]TEB43442.1 glycosyltransferase [Flavobacterium circumlabens]